MGNPHNWRGMGKQAAVERFRCDTRPKLDFAPLVGKNLG
jgi:hypothetical protein